MTSPRYLSPWFSPLVGFCAVGMAFQVHAAGPASTLTIPGTTNRIVVTPSAPATNNTSFDLNAFERDRVLNQAMAALATEPVTITKYHPKFSAGGPNDFYSQGESWFPDPTKPDGMPYKQHIGQTNPDNDVAHRKCLTQMRDNVTALAAAYKITGNNRYAGVAAEWLRVFFLDPTTRMNPNLDYAEAVPGLLKGRSIGVSDTVPLAEIPKAIEAIQSSPSFPSNVLSGMKQWSMDYLDWLVTSTNGDDVASLGNNHSVIYWLQVASFSDLVGDDGQLATCRTRYKFFLLPLIGTDGSFTRLPKAKTYTTAVCVFEEMTALCQVLSTSNNEDLWQYTTPAGRSIHSAANYMYPFLDDKSQWPKPLDTSESIWPARQGSLLFAYLAYNDPKYLATWKKLPAAPADERVRWDEVVTQPVLWVK